MDAYTELRDATLQQLRRELEFDERFVAAWLTGSFGRGEEDEFSDIDLTIVVDDAHAVRVCETNARSNAGTSAVRQQIVSRYGEPIVVHEHHGNAPAGGSFTSVVYRTGLVIDWIFVPGSEALRPMATTLLFDAVGVPIQREPPPSNDAEIAARLAERSAFFWLLAIPAAKAWRRGDGGKFQAVLELMHGAERDILAALRGELPAYTRRSLAPFCPTRGEQRQALRDVCRRTAALSGELRAAGAEVPERPMAVVETWLKL